MAALVLWRSVNECKYQLVCSRRLQIIQVRVGGLASEAVCFPRLTGGRVSELGLIYPFCRQGVYPRAPSPFGVRNPSLREYHFSIYSPKEQYVPESLYPQLLILTDNVCARRSNLKGPISRRRSCSSHGTLQISADDTFQSDERPRIHALDPYRDNSAFEEKNGAAQRELSACTAVHFNVRTELQRGFKEPKELGNRIASRRE